MNVKEEWVFWSGESSYNRDSEQGIHPKVERGKFPCTFTRLFYCYYSPKLRGEQSCESYCIVLHCIVIFLVVELTAVLLLLWVDEAFLCSFF